LHMYVLARLCFAFDLVQIHVTVHVLKIPFCTLQETVKVSWRLVYILWKGVVVGDRLCSEVECSHRRGECVGWGGVGGGEVGGWFWE
jgi:hypothetical protein